MARARKGTITGSFVGPDLPSPEQRTSHSLAGLDLLTFVQASRSRPVKESEETMTTELMATLGGLLFLVVLVAALTGDGRYRGETVIVLPQVIPDPPQPSGLVAIFALLLLLLAVVALAG
jgi:hypothetical protein